jgi:hypothetical protein
MDSQTLIDGYHHIIDQIYSRRMYYERILVFLQNYIPTAKSRLCKEDVKAFLRSMLKIGVFSRSNLLYWRLMLKTLFTNARSLPVVVELMICWEHYSTMRKRLLSAKTSGSRAVQA